MRARAASVYYRTLGMENVSSHRISNASHSSKERAVVSFEGSRSETESWLMVRKCLLETQTFAKPLEAISETEWLESRVISLKVLLDYCSNFHGGPTGELWSIITDTVKSHLGSQHAFVNLISEHQHNMWPTCSLVTVATLSEDASLDAQEGPQPQMSLSLPSTQQLQSYGSIELIEPSGKDGRRLCMHHLNWKWLLVYSPLLLALSAVIAAAVTLSQITPETTKKVETLEGTTVYLDTQKSVWYEGWSVSDCSSSSEPLSDNGRSNITSNIQLVDSEDVVYYEENVMEEEVEGYQNSQLLKTLNGPLYLLAGSSVEYEFCLTTNFSSHNSHHLRFTGEFLIFNDVVSYSNYLHHSGHMGKEAAIFFQEMPIPGIDREEMCTSVIFNVSQADLYFTTYKLPPQVELHYQSNIHIVYLNYTKYVSKEAGECELELGGSCEITIPENIFSTEDYTILAYIPLQLPDIAPNSTQLCVTPRQSTLVSVVPGVVTAFVLLLLLVAITCQIISFLGSMKRRNVLSCKTSS